LSSLSSSSCSSGSLPNNCNRPYTFDVLKPTAWKPGRISFRLDVA
jgi:hypothetical protein